MRNTVINIITIGCILLSLAQPSRAAETSNNSAKLKPEALVEFSTVDIESQIQEAAIYNVLKRYNSPLADDAETFVTTARALDLDPYLLPSIAGVESGFGRQYIRSTHNVFGYGRGEIKFDNFSHGIARVGYALRYRYINSGAHSLDQIGHIYAGGSTTWAGKVSSFMRKFEAEEQKLRIITLII